MDNMAIRIVKFSNGGTKLEKKLPNNQHYPGKLLTLKIGLMGASENFKNKSFKSQSFSSSQEKKIPEIEIMA